MKNQKDRPVFEIPTVRLTADETRLILRCAQTDNPVQAYNGAALLEIGIIKKVVIRSAPSPQEIERRWKLLEDAASKRSLSASKSAINGLDSLLSKYEKSGYVLTALGKELARGLSVRISKHR